MNILGFGCFHHNAAAALLLDGEIAAMAEEERFTRVKHDGAFPENAIRFCLNQAGLKVHDIDHVAFYYKRFLGIPRRIGIVMKGFPDSIRLASGQGGEFFRILNVKRTTKSFFRKLDDSEPVFGFHHVNHHVAHLCSAFYPSPFERSAVLSIDGNGEIASTLGGVMENNNLRLLLEVDFPNSIGNFYSAITEYLGFRNNDGEGRVMGLAPYGKPEFADKLWRTIKLHDNGGFSLDMSYYGFHHSSEMWFTQKLIRLLGFPPRNSDEPLTEEYKNLAASVQSITEEAVLHIADKLQKRTGEDRLCLAGGVALNSVMNTRLATELAYKDVFVQPSANDAGTALGAALALHHLTFGGERRSGVRKIFSPYLGPSYSDEIIQKAVSARGIDYERLDNPVYKAAKLLSKGRIVGWFQGRMEVGPRALGNRSILAHPGISGMKDKLNEKVKHRESFRPFAPSVLFEKAEDFFRMSVDSPYMLFVLKALESRRNEIPEVVHVDGTGRVQTVRRELNPLFYELIDRFYDLTGIPLVLNTSFNVRGEPIVCSPDDALSCFLGTEMDDLFLGNYYISTSAKKNRDKRQ